MTDIALSSVNRLAPAALALEHLAHLDAEATALTARATTESSKMAYRGDLRRFLTWCRLIGLAPASTPYTTSTADADLHLVLVELAGRVGVENLGPVLRLYATQLTTEDKAVSTIDRALASLLVACKAGGLSKPDTAGARDVLNGYRRQRADDRRPPPRQADPIYVEHLQILVAGLDQTYGTGSLRTRRDSAMFLTGYAMGARRSELLALDRPDIQFVREGMLLTIIRSKTDQEGRSASKPVPIPYGRHRETCPVLAMLAWTNALAEAGINDGPVFRRVDRHHRLGGAGASGTGGSRLTGRGFAAILQKDFELCGLDYDPDLDRQPVISPHGLRRGFASEAKRNGVGDLEIARHGRWVDGSRALYRYLAEAGRWDENPLNRSGL